MCKQHCSVADLNYFTLCCRIQYVSGSKRLSRLLSLAITEQTVWNYTSFQHSCVFDCCCCSDILSSVPSGLSSWCLESAWLTSAIGLFLPRWCCWRCMEDICVSWEHNATWRGKSSWNWQQRTRTLKSSKTDFTFVHMWTFSHSSSFFFFPSLNHEDVCSSQDVGVNSLYECRALTRKIIFFHFSKNITCTSGLYQIHAVSGTDSELKMAVIICIIFY